MTTYKTLPKRNYRFGLATAQNLAKKKVLNCILLLIIIIIIGNFDVKNEKIQWMVEYIEEFVKWFCD